MKKYFLVLLLAAYAFSPHYLNGEEKRNIEVGVLADTHYSPDRMKQINHSFNRIASYGLQPEKTDASIFLAGNKTARDRYKRILVLFYSIFTPEMYAGMEDYVRSGGLLIMNSPMDQTDMNGNYVFDKGTDKTIRNRIHGIHAFANVKLKNIAVKLESPLTKGLENGKVHESSSMMSETKETGATVIVTATAFRTWGSQKNQETPIKNMPVLAFLHLGEGAFIYIGIPDNETLFRNCFSREVLDWLTNN